MGGLYLEWSYDHGYDVDDILPDCPGCCKSNEVIMVGSSLEKNSNKKLEVIPVWNCKRCKKMFAGTSNNVDTTSSTYGTTRSEVDLASINHNSIDTFFGNGNSFEQEVKQIIQNALGYGASDVNLDCHPSVERVRDQIGELQADVENLEETYRIRKSDPLIDLRERVSSFELRL